MNQSTSTPQELTAALPYRVKLLGSSYVAAFCSPAAAGAYAMRESRLDSTLTYVVESPDAPPAYWQNGNPVRDPAALGEATGVRKLSDRAGNARASETVPLEARIAARDVHYQLIERFDLADDPPTNAAVRELLVGLATENRR
jgi:hypothetical protein